MQPNAKILSYILAILFSLMATAALADSNPYSTVGAGGYNLVSYRTGEKPQRGNGNHLVVHEGITYLFTNEKNKKDFATDPERYLPMYGGYCAYGVAVGKKFVGDPEV